MVRRHNRLLVAFYVISDAVLGIAAFVLAYVLRFESGFIPVTKGFPPFSQYVNVLPFIGVLVPFAFHIQGLYRLRRGRSRVDDFFAVLDAYGVERAVVIGWSLGVNVAFEAALRAPERIAGVLAVAGVPGGSFDALLHPLPRFLRPRAGRAGAHLMRYLGPVLNRIGDGLPGTPEHGFDPRGVGTLGLDLVHGDVLIRVLRRFANHDWPWYSRLARAVGDHPPVDLSLIDMPVTYVAGTWDSITSAKMMRIASEHTPHSRYVELPATHFVPLQFPARMSTELHSLVDRCRLT